MDAVAPLSGLVQKAATPWTHRHNQSPTLMTSSLSAVPSPVSRIAGRLLLQHTLAATQCLTTYSTTSSRGYHHTHAHVSNAIPYVSNAIPW